MSAKNSEHLWVSPIIVIDETVRSVIVRQSAVFDTVVIYKPVGEERSRIDLGGDDYVWVRGRAVIHSNMLDPDPDWEVT